MIKKRDFGALLAIAIFSLAALSFHAYIGSLSRFLADDYCVAYYARHFGFLRSIWYWYISWSGTFSNSIFDWLLVFIKPGGIRFVTPVVLLVWVLITIISTLKSIILKYGILNPTIFSICLAFIVMAFTINQAI